MHPRAICPPSGLLPRRRALGAPSLEPQPPPPPPARTGAHICVCSVQLLFVWGKIFTLESFGNHCWKNIKRNGISFLKTNLDNLALPALPCRGDTQSLLTSWMSERRQGQIQGERIQLLIISKFHLTSWGFNKMPPSLLSSLCIFYISLLLLPTCY